MYHVKVRGPVVQTFRLPIGPGVRLKEPDVVYEVLLLTALLVISVAWVAPVRPWE